MQRLVGESGPIYRGGRINLDRRGGGSPPPSSLILDSLSAGAAFSERKLRTGADLALRARRSSDNAEADFGFAATPQTRINLIPVPISNNGAGVAGVTMTTLGSGTEFGLPYVDVRWVGTATASGTFIVFRQGVAATFNPATHAPVTPGLTYTASLGYRLIAGNWNLPVPQFRIVQRQANSTALTFGTAFSVPAPTAVMQRFAASEVMQAGAVYAVPQWQATLSLNQTVDFTLRFYALNVELGVGNIRPLLLRNEPEVVSPAGGLDVESLMNFVGMGTGFVTAQYDQSGNNRHVLNATPSQQPRIVNAGVVDQAGGRPTVVYSGGQWLSAAAAASVVQAFSVLAPSVFSGTANFQYGFGSTQLIALTPSTTSRRVGAGGAANDFSDAFDTGVLRQYTDGRAPNTMRRDGITSAIGAAATSVGPTTVQIGARDGAIPFIGVFSELIGFADPISPQDRQTLERNQGAYFNIAVA